MGKSALLDKAINTVQRLPEAEQDEVARVMIEVLQAENKWQKLFGEPASEAALDDLVDQARQEIASGDVSDKTPADLGKD